MDEIDLDLVETVPGHSGPPSYHLNVSRMEFSNLLYFFGLNPAETISRKENPVSESVLH